MDVANLIVIERQRQLQKFDADHDDVLTHGELLSGAFAYLCVPGDDLWPTDLAHYRPSRDPVRNLVRAGALIAAEGDRLLRRQLTQLEAYLKENNGHQSIVH